MIMSQKYKNYYYKHLNTKTKTLKILIRHLIWCIKNQKI